MRLSTWARAAGVGILACTFALVAAACSGEAGSGANGNGSAGAASAPGKDAGSLDTSGYSNAKLISRIYNGEFRTIERIALQASNGSREVQMQINMMVVGYHSAYALSCKKEIAREPATEIAYSEHDVDDDGNRVSADRQTGATMVRDRFYPDYNQAASAISGLSVLGSFGMNATDFTLSIAGDMRNLVRATGCTSPKLLQFETNLHRLFHGEKPVQSEWGGIAGIPEFSAMCRNPEILGGRLKSDKACRCAYDALAENAMGEHILIVESAMDETTLVGEIMAEPGLARKIQECAR